MPIITGGEIQCARPFEVMTSGAAATIVSAKADPRIDKGVEHVGGQVGQ